MSSTNINELIVRFKGDTAGLEAATQRAEKVVQNFRTTSMAALRVVGIGAAGALAGIAAIGIEGATKTDAFKAAAERARVQLENLRKTIDQSTGASDIMGSVLVGALNQSASAAVALQAVVIDLNREFKVANVQAKHLLTNATNALTKFSAATTKAVGDTLGLDTSSPILNTSGLKDSDKSKADLEIARIRLDAAKKIIDAGEEYKTNLNDQAMLARLLSTEEEKLNAGRIRSKTIIDENKEAAKAAAEAALEWQQAQADATSEMIASLEQAAERQRTVINHLSDSIYDVSRGFSDLRDVAISALDDIAKNMLRLSMGGSADSGFGGIIGSSLMTGIAGMFGGGPALSAGAIGLGQQGGLLQFATGGSFQVGGTGGTDSQLVQFKASPNERVTVERPGQNLRGGPQVNVTVNNNNGSRVSIQEQQTPSGRDLVMTIDEIVAGQLGTRGSKSNRQIRALNNQGLARR